METFTDYQYDQFNDYSFYWVCLKDKENFEGGEKVRKLTIILLLISFSLVFAGAAAAAPEVDVSVVDENGDVNVTSPGDEVNLTANATTDEYLYDPVVLVSVDPESGLQFKEDEAVMIYDGDTFTNDPEDPFFFWSDEYESWVWWVGWLWGDQLPGEDAQLFLPATVRATGEITVNAQYLKWDVEPILLATDSYTFQSAEPGPVNPANGETVPMQDTGVPLAAAAIGLLSIIGGAVYGKFR